MRRGICIILAALTSGCVSQSETIRPLFNARQPNHAAPLVKRDYEPSAAGSLAFDPPVTLGQAPLELSRDLRTPDAFVAYESSVATYFWIRTDDLDRTFDNDGRFDRRAISTKVGVTYR